MSAPYPASYAADHGRFVVVPAAYVFLLRTGTTCGRLKVLLQLRRGTGYMDGHWAAAAAGHVERGETAVDAARRETREEIGIDVADLTFLTAMQRTRHDQAIDERIDFFFTARTWTGEPRVLEPAKSAGLRWWPVGELPAVDADEPVVPHERVVLDALATGSIEPYTTFGF